MANETLRAARIAAGYSSAAEAARAIGVPEPTYVSHENGTRGLRPNSARHYAKAFGVPAEALLFSADAPDAASVLSPTGRQSAHVSRTKLVPPFYIGEPSVPLYGYAAAGGNNGRFVISGEKIGATFRPASLEGVPDAYSVYVHGESMVPRYEPGEAVWVNPHVPPRRDDYVVVQIMEPNDPQIYGYVKRFRQMKADELVLAQFNPEGDLRFPTKQVKAVHKIVFAGQP